MDEYIDIRKLYQVIQGRNENVKLNVSGELHLGTPLFMGCNLDIEIYEWKMENYESR